MIISYSFLNDYQNCPRKTYHKYVARDLPREDSTALRHGNVVHKLLEDAINEGKPVPSEYPYEAYITALRKLPATLKAEVKLAATDDGRACEWSDPKVAFRGKVDVLVNTETEAVLVDWKTGKIREDPLELEVQGFLVRVNLGADRVSGYYVWLSEGKIGKRFELNNHSRMHSKLQTTRNEVMNLKEWRPKPSGLCGYCLLKSCEFNRR